MRSHCIRESTDSRHLEFDSLSVRYLETKNAIVMACGTKKKPKGKGGK